MAVDGVDIEFEGMLVAAVVRRRWIEGLLWAEERRRTGNWTCYKRDDGSE